MNIFKSYFPFFSNHPELIYLDNAATMQKPQQVIDALSDYYLHSNAPVHRGVYEIAENATVLYERARSTVACFLNAHDDELIFTRGTTESINFVATAWAERMLKEGDEIILTELEHHSNILPWIRLEQTNGIVLKYIPLHDDGTLNYETYKSLLNKKTKLVACTAISNVLGCSVDLEYIITHAHECGARVLVDAAQAVGRMPLNVRQLKADFLTFSAHKMYGPMGSGVLYLPRHMQSETEPYQVGGGMVYSVDWHEAQWAKAPLKYEAGTPSVANALGLEAAINFIQKNIDYDELKKQQAAFCDQLIEVLRTIPSIRILGSIDQLRKNGHMVSFVSDRAHPHDVAAYLDTHGICVRAGNHCAQPLHKRLGISSSIRVSFAAYTTALDVDKLIQALLLLQ